MTQAARQMLAKLKRWVAREGDEGLIAIKVHVEMDPDNRANNEIDVSTANCEAAHLIMAADGLISHAITRLLGEPAAKTSLPLIERLEEVRRRLGTGLRRVELGRADGIDAGPTVGGRA